MASWAWLTYTPITDMKPLRKGSTGQQVKSLQFFLLGLGLLKDGIADGSFGPKTEEAVKLYQRSRRLSSDGIVGGATIEKMRLDGYKDLQPVATFTPAQEYPARPSFPCFLGNEQRMQYFGRFRWEHRPEPGNRENIVILGDWVEENIVQVDIPQLHKLGFNKPRSFHRKAAERVVELWDAFEKEGVLEDIISYEGDFFPRLIRGSSTSLSNHAFGSAFDVNAAQNGLGRTPARPGQKGCLYRLVPIAARFGFYWGGHFSRLDGMHFELGKV